MPGFITPGIDARLDGTQRRDPELADLRRAAMARGRRRCAGPRRSIAVPIKAVAGFLLTIGASVGLVVFIFRHGHLGGLFGVENTGPIIGFLAILMIAILFGLAMDYEVFLVSRMRESHTKTADAQHSTVAGFQASARVVTAAGLIMIAVFSGFVLAPDPITKSIGLALAFGVLVDAFLVRMTIIPAVLALLGDRAWWLPGWLERRLPHLDIEGDGLARTRPGDRRPATAPAAAAD